MTTIHQKSPGLSPDLYKHMYDTLIKCNQFDTDEKLRSIFIDSRIAPWRNKLPQANDCDSRVLLIIDFLYVRHNTSGDNALVLFLHVLSERIDSGDALCCELLALAKEIEGSPPPPLLIPETVLIPAGDFCMGSEPGDPLAFSNETPRRRLNLPVYAIGKYPVTNAEYLDFVRANPRYTPSHWINDRIPEEKENHPVINVNLQNAQAYCQWLIEQTGRQYRLPTEEEWEKAARGAWPETRRYPWGDDWDRACFNTKSTNYSDTTPVNTFEGKNTSFFKVVDMVGNVWEWTNTPYKEGRYVIRGGSFRYEARFARNSCRGRCRPENQDPDLGFRIVQIFGG